MTEVTDATREEAELLMLRRFYDAWVAFHQIPKNDKWRRKHQELAAQRITDAHYAIQRFHALDRLPEALNA